MGPLNARGTLLRLMLLQNGAMSRSGILSPDEFHVLTYCLKSSHRHNVFVKGGRGSANFPSAITSSLLVERW